MLPTRQPCIFNRLRSAQEVKEYFVSGAEQICPTVSLVGVPSFDDSKWFIEEIGRAPGRARLPDSNHPKSPALLSEQLPMGGPCSALGTTEFSTLVLLSGLLGAPESVLHVSKSGRSCEINLRV